MILGAHSNPIMAMSEANGRDRRTDRRSALSWPSDLAFVSAVPDKEVNEMMPLTI
jgi:hypothetical protein